MSNLTLTDARVRALRPRKSTYNIRDAKFRGFGVRVLPSGVRRFFLHIQHRGQRAWNIVGDANAMPVADARTQAASMLAAIRFGAEAPHDAPSFESVAETVFRRYAQVWRPQTLYVNRNYLRRQILPHFADAPIADITRADVRRWFASRRATPVAADRSMPVLSVILTEAERMGLRPEGSNPCRGIRRYRRKGRERFLTDAEFEKLGRVLDEAETQGGASAGAVAAIRLLMLTGCHKNEILSLRWRDVDLDTGELALAATRRPARARCRCRPLRRGCWRHCRVKTAIPGSSRGTSRART